VAPRPHPTSITILPVPHQVAWGRAIAEIYTADTLGPLGVSLDMWRVLARCPNNGEQRRSFLSDDLDRRATMSAAGDAGWCAGPGNADAFEDLQPRGGCGAVRPKAGRRSESLIPIAKKLEGTPWTACRRKDLAIVKRALRRITSTSPTAATNRAERAALNGVALNEARRPRMR